MKTDLRSSKQLTSWRIRASPRRALSRLEREANSHERVLRPAVFGTERAPARICRHINTAHRPLLFRISLRELPAAPFSGGMLTRDTFRPGLISGLPRAPLPVENAAAQQTHASRASLLPHWGVATRAPAPEAAFCGLEAPRPKRYAYQGQGFLVANGY